MVKNTHGGSGHKKFARKHTGAVSSNKLRVSEDEGEIYAVVTKMLGNGMFHCYCIDGTVRLGHIRGKFTGRGKRNNLVECGKWILIGLREWDVPSKKSYSVSKEKIQKCDLLEVYSDSDKQRLKESVSEDWLILDTNDVSKVTLGETNVSDDFIFGTDRDFERERLIQEIHSSKAEIITFRDCESDEKTDSELIKEEDINIDDI